ncbi:hypothetical protein ACFWAK_02590 [Streptomyces sp. NPDC059918]
MLLAAPSAQAAAVTNGCTVSGQRVTCVNYGGINQQSDLPRWTAYQYNVNGIKFNRCSARYPWRITCINY